MKRIATTGARVRILVPVFVCVLCVLIGSGVYAGGDRDKKKKSAGKSTARKQEQTSRKDSGGQASSPIRRAASQALKKSNKASSERQSSGARSGAESRTVNGRGESRSSDDARVTREWNDTDRDRDRTGHRRGDESDKRRGGDKKKKDNPGFGKKIKREGEKGHKRIPPRGGGRKIQPTPGGGIKWRPNPRPPKPPHPRPPRPPYPHPYPVYVIPEPYYPSHGIGGYYSGSDYEIHLPAGIIEPDGMEPEFIEKIDYIRSIGRGDSLLVCLFQTVDPMAKEEINYLFERGVTFYRFLTAYTAIVDVSVEDIFLLVMDMPNFRWIGEYLPEYKYRHDRPESNRRGAYVQSLVGDSIEFRNALKHIGIRVVTYYEETEDYYVVADWEQFPEIAELWWVEKVYKEPESFSEVSVSD